MNVIHIAPRRLWNEASRLGRYAPPSLASDGFIHCSTVDQVLGVARRFYVGQRGLALLVIDPARLTSALKWEPPADPAPAGASAPVGTAGELFPHIYGPINLDAVVQVLAFEPDADGEFSLPEPLLAGG